MLPSSDPAALRRRAAAIKKEPGGGEAEEVRPRLEEKAKRLSEAAGKPKR
jgi:hypothetical protein